MEIPLFTGIPAKSGKFGLTARAAQFKINAAMIAASIRTRHQPTLVHRGDDAPDDLEI